MIKTGSSITSKSKASKRSKIYFMMELITDGLKSKISDFYFATSPKPSPQGEGIPLLLAGEGVRG